MEQDWRTAPMRAAVFIKHRPQITRAPDGTIYVADESELPPYDARTTDALVRWAGEDPDALFLADRKTDAGWRKVSYGEMLERVRRLGQALLDLGLSAERPLAILSGNDIDHAALMLAAMHVGIPSAAISPAYSTMGGTHNRLRDCFAAVTPGAVYVADPGPVAAALEAVASGLPVFSDRGGHGTRPLAELDAVEPTGAVEAANAKVTGETVAKFLFTSGSTGSPKAVPNHHAMITAAQGMIRECFAYMKDERPVVLDWAPWHHTAGGNHVFFMTLMNGGELWVDDGRPTPADTPKTVRNLREVRPTWYFNVPAGFDAIIPFLEKDAEFREAFYSRIKMLWYAGASLGQQSWDKLESMAVETIGARVQIGTGLGATETGPGALFCTWPQEMAGNVGLPAPGCTLKLVPMEGHYDARVKGPNIMKGYWRRPDLDPFDDEGFYKFGDALKPVDPDDFAQGFKFDGRTAENFKLTTGTWVVTGALRTAAVNHFGRHVRDLALTGPDRPFLGALVFPPAPEKADDPEWRAELAVLLKSLAAKATGSSNRIQRVLVIPDVPQMSAGEVTDKGSLNQRAVLAHRSDLVDELYAGSERTIDIRG